MERAANRARGHDHFYAMGWGGQFIVCVPDFDLVVVATCDCTGVSDKEARRNWHDIFFTIMDSILPAVQE
jgi:CubicO group peptidase (beta-lactamase class C family)